MLFAEKKAENVNLQIYSVALCQNFLEIMSHWYSFQAN